MSEKDMGGYVVWTERESKNAGRQTHILGPFEARQDAEKAAIAAIGTGALIVEVRMAFDDKMQERRKWLDGNMN